MSLAIPIVAVQANIVEVNGQKALHLTRVLDTYEEPEEPGANQRGILADKLSLNSGSSKGSVRSRDARASTGFA
jgi:hypothetical protein